MARLPWVPAGLLALLRARACAGSSRCPLDRVRGLTEERFKADYQGKRGVIIRGGAAEWSSLGWGPDEFAERYGDYDVRFYDSSQFVSRGTRARVLANMSVGSYIVSLADQELPAFENRYTDLVRAVCGGVRMESLPVYSVRQFRVVSLGAKRTGVGFHNHDEGWLAQVRGRKGWFLSVASERPSNELHPCHMSRDQLPPGMVYCVVKPTDILYIPRGVWHATCNLDGWTLGIGGGTDVSALPPLQLAVYDGDETAVRRLVEAGASAAELSNASRAAAITGRVSMLALLGELGPGYTVADFSSLVPSAIPNGQVAVVRWMLERGADPDLRDDRGVAMLHWAALYSQPAIAQLLLAQGGADPSLRLPEALGGDAALHLAAHECDAGVAAQLVAARPHGRRDRNAAGATPGEVARQQGCGPSLLKLLEGAAGGADDEL